jgi:hypothetical protein
MKRWGDGDSRGNGRYRDKETYRRMKESYPDAKILTQLCQCALCNADRILQHGALSSSDFAHFFSAPCTGHSQRWTILSI